MKRLVILSACLAISLAGWAQGNRNDSLKMDSIIHSLPDVMVKGNRPIVKVKGSALTYDLPQLIKNHPVDNAYEAIKQLPGVSEQDEALTLNAQSVTVMIDGKATTMTSEQLYSLLKRFLPAASPTLKLSIQPQPAIRLRDKSSTSC